MKILIIGGNRFFGKRLVNNLLKQGHELTVMNRGSSPNSNKDVEHIQIDRNDITLLSARTKGRKWDAIVDQVCFDSTQALNAVEVFSNKTDNYIFTSSQSVYKWGESLTEKNFDPYNYQFAKPVSTEDDYSEAKRQAETAFYQKAEFKVTAVRIPIVMGEDDYTGRFKWHCDRVMNSTPMNIPNINSEISFISSEDAARALEFLVQNPVGKPVNFCSDDIFSLQGFITELEKQTGHKARIDFAADHSPYGVPENWTMSNELSHQIGFSAQEGWPWVESLISVFINRPA